MVAWHLKGAAGTFDQWLAISEFDRAIIVSETRRRIRAHNAMFDDL